MRTVNDIIQDALEDLVVQAEEAPIEAAEAQACIRALNRMMAQYASRGINLGYTIVDSVDDVVTIPDGALDAVVANLALRLAPKYRTTGVSQELINAANIGEDALFAIAVEVAEVEYPSTLPIGSGNDYTGSPTEKFYPDKDSVVLSEQSGSISLESETEEA